MRIQSILLILVITLAVAILAFLLVKPSVPTIETFTFNNDSDGSTVIVKNNDKGIWYTNTSLNTELEDEYGFSTLIYDMVCYTMAEEISNNNGTYDSEILDFVRDYEFVGINVHFNNEFYCGINSDGEFNY